MTASPAGSLQLLVGLGNPGEKYAGTRHNVGFMALERLAAAAGVPFKNQAKLHGLFCEVGQGASRLRLLMPQTFMNDSGRSIRAALDWYGLVPSQLLLLVDDMDLPLGRLRLRASGGAGGHNGLRSTIAHLGGQEFARLRIGIGAPSANPVERKERTISHVLGRFQASEQPILQEVLEEVGAGIGLIQRLGLERAANRLNSFVAPSAAKLVESVDQAKAQAQGPAQAPARSPAPSRPSP
jgi:PTH1 family peptidyl-tRNA hydrolase